MKILVACECSGRVREAFRRKGHDAWSADIQPADDGSEFHLQGDVLEVLNEGWDLMIGHPPCTYLCNSGVCHLHTEEGRWAKMYQGVTFFRKLWRAPVERICLENPIMHGYAQRHIREPYTQIIHPWEHGHMEQKQTCLWLKNLEWLRPTHNVYHDMMRLPKAERERLHYLPKTKDRGKLRSVTFQGIADAFAAQWG